MTLTIQGPVPEIGDLIVVASAEMVQSTPGLDDVCHYTPEAGVVVHGVDGAFLLRSLDGRRIWRLDWATGFHLIEGERDYGNGSSG